MQLVKYFESLIYLVDSIVGATDQTEVAEPCLFSREILIWLPFQRAKHSLDSLPGWHPYRYKHWDSVMFFSLFDFYNIFTFLNNKFRLILDKRVDGEWCQMILISVVTSFNLTHHTWIYSLMYCSWNQRFRKRTKNKYVS